MVDQLKSRLTIRSKRGEINTEKPIAEDKVNIANITFQILFIFDAKSLVKIMQQRYALELLNRENLSLGLMFICNQKTMQR